MTDATMHVVLPTYRPAGGVVKAMDYVTHAMDHGYRITVTCARPRAEREPLFEISRFEHLTSHPDVALGTSLGRLGADDVVFISLPTHYEQARAALGPGLAADRLVHIVQGVRHANPDWLGGQPLRTLARPASRISINSIVGDAIAPYLDGRGLHRVINAGHDLEFFAQRRSGGLGDVVNVAYTTWKSPVGDRVAERLAGDPRFEFRAIRETVSWVELRELYQWADVFLCAPGPEEGLYLPGLEALAAGLLVVSPDVGGNMSYCRPGSNCVMVGYEDVDGYVAALESITRMSVARIGDMRLAGSDVCREFDLAQERTEFHRYLDDVQARARSREGRPTSSGQEPDRTGTVQDSSTELLAV
jgi:hypothetical protein